MKTTGSHTLLSLGAGVLGVGIAIGCLAGGPDAVSRGEMREYVKVTSVEPLREIKEELVRVRAVLGKVREGLAANRALLSGEGRNAAEICQD